MYSEGIKPIGGYFELELPLGDLPHPCATRFQSARAAFFALLCAGMPRRVWMPRFICDAMYSPLEQAGIRYLSYDVDDQLLITGDIKLKTGDWLLYVNYFGLCGRNIEVLKRRFPARQMILDFSQAFLEPPDDEVLATIYSPRKYFGVPDGGMLYTNIPMQRPKDRYTESINHVAHLIKCLSDSPEAGYLDFIKSEERLKNCVPKGMSILTERILSSVNVDRAIQRRRENFMFLDDKLGFLNKHSIKLTKKAVPLCYPFRSDEERLRKRLLANRIYVPTYWTDALSRVGGEWGTRMIESLVPLPVDHRYDLEDMRRVVSIVIEEGT